MQRPGILLWGQMSSCRSTKPHAGQHGGNSLNVWSLRGVLGYSCVFWGVGNLWPVGVEAVGSGFLPAHSCTVPINIHRVIEICNWKTYNVF